MSFKSCYLRFLNNPQKRIYLPANKPVNIGRSAETEIKDIHLSRNQLEFTADLNNGKVILKTIGKCYSGCNGYALMQNETYCLKHGDRIELKLGSYELELVFEPNVEDKEPPEKRTKLNESTDEVKKDGQWEEVDGREVLIYTPPNSIGQAKIGAFDLDGTLIKTKSGSRFPKNYEDWVFNFDNVVNKLKKLHENKYKIVIFSNQMGLGRDLNKIVPFKKKIEAITSATSLPIQTYIATGRSFYRKPAPGMWNELEIRNGVPISMSDSFYVGDAAGREKKWAPGKNKDHSIGDRLFALNLDLKFYTPEEYFSNAKSVPFKMPEFDPTIIPTAVYPEVEPKFEVILMVGSPASGKSHYCKTQLVPKGYIHISRDKLGTWQKCVKQMEECLQKNQSVVIDNTNPNKDSRQRFIEAAKKIDVDCRCFVMDINFKHIKHNNRFREMIDKSHVPVTDVMLNTYKNKYEQPALNEGFSEILTIPFCAQFDKKEHEQLYRKYLMES